MDGEYEIYGGFAEVYDTFMDNIPYDVWHDYLKSLLNDCGISEGIVVDLGCGTGNMTVRLAEDGYDMIGVDLSPEMLEIARDKCPDRVLLLHQDMRELDLYGSAHAVVCVCDGMNYLLENEDLIQTFRRVAAFLEEDGVFIFDMKTEYFYEQILGNRTIAENREDASFIWENEYHSESGINEYLLTVYRLVSDEQDLFERTDEYHRQRAYPWEQVRDLLTTAGLRPEAVYEAFTRNAPEEKSERLYFVARPDRRSGTDR